MIGRIAPKLALILMPLVIMVSSAMRVEGGFVGFLASGIPAFSEIMLVLIGCMALAGGLAAIRVRRNA